MKQKKLSYRLENRASASYILFHYNAAFENFAGA